ncbi:hypothetical protein QYM36_019611 [Artemia franciscana]|uniref:RNA-directed DNA polymerase n=1 Tax=Artemia franciscana TaxID=6661 RepID=A0AA88H510_ARTSF|nr:hypothetical protein QYM36_019611 [Artemia franciscana]
MPEAWKKCRVLHINLLCRFERRIPEILMIAFDINLKVCGRMNGGDSEVCCDLCESGRKWKEFSFCSGSKKKMEELLSLLQDFREAFSGTPIKTRIVKHLIRTEKIQKARLRNHPKKAKIAHNEVCYLGQCINGEIFPLDSRVQAVKDFLLPVSKKEIRSFIGMTAYFQRFIKYFAEIAEPLTSLLKEGFSNKLELHKIQVGAFEILKQALIFAPICDIRDFNKNFTLRRDASDIGFGVVLSQKYGEVHPIAFLSGKLFPAEKRYSIVEKEALALK